MAKNYRSTMRGVKNPVEALEDIARGTADSLVEDVAKSGTKDFFKQLIGYSLGETISEKSKNSEHEVFNASMKPKNELTPLHFEPGIDYHRDIIKSSERASKRELREMDSRLREIVVELRKLISSSKALQMEFSEVTVEHTGENIGEYHINFFEWLLSVIREARRKVEDSSAWVSAIKGKGKKKSYWGMFKKHGTTFGLSNERVVATQTG